MHTSARDTGNVVMKTLLWHLSVALCLVTVDGFVVDLAFPLRPRVSCWATELDELRHSASLILSVRHLNLYKHPMQTQGYVEDTTLSHTVENTAGAQGTRTKTLEEAFGKGQGKHAGSKRRQHANKYRSKSKTKTLDPWEAQLRQSEESKHEAEALQRAEIEEIAEKRRRRREQRVSQGEEIVYPDEEDIDPYDPSTFGYIEVGHVQGAHGIKGEVKVRSATDFGVQRLCTPGVKYIKAPNRRFPRDVELVAGRLQKEDIFLVQLEGIKSRDAAAALRGHKVYVLKDDEVELEDNEYLVRDIVGARAYRADDDSVFMGDVVGVVLGNDVSSTIGLASDSLELRLPIEAPGEVPKVCYVPFVPAFVPFVRLNPASDGGPHVLLDLPDGLLDLAVEVEEKVVIKGFLSGRMSTKSR